jgi:gamma-glutamylcyclotransferase (GGCT)/AIG2-like uncharacterized protein YtfP
MNLVFVYGTLKRGFANHRLMEGQEFIGAARTAPGYALYDLGGYPGMVADPAAAEGVGGEVWSVDDECLSGLDVLEGTSEGLYRRERVALLEPFEERHVEAYLYLRSVEGAKRLGGAWGP